LNTSELQCCNNIISLGGITMPLVTTTEMFKKAYAGNYAVGAFNVNNMEIIQGIVDAAKAEKSPIILQVSAGARKYAKHIYLMKLVEAAVEDSGLPIALHLDHGDDFEVCKSCIDGGFTSVMIDGSKHSFEDNIALTKRVVEYAHERGVVVEAELGKLAGVEDDVKVEAKDAIYTNPDQAVEFVQRTGVDSLAIAIGTSHGAYKFKGEPKLDFERLEKITNLLPNFPIVLHGASTVIPEFVDLCNKYGGSVAGAQGVPENLLRQAAQLGVCKINIDTDLRLAMTASIRKHLAENPGDFDPRQYLKPAREALQAMVAHKMKNVLGSSNKL
jgi:fructose-bisphosphate aldolase class II